MSIKNRKVWIFAVVLSSFILCGDNAVGENLRIFRSWHGSGVMSTDAFNISSDNWKIEYTQKGPEEYLLITVYKKEKNKFSLSEAIGSAETKGESWVHESGTFYLNINGTSNWEVKVFVP